MMRAHHSRNRRLAYACVSAVALAVILLLMTTAALAGIRWSSNGVAVCTESHQQWAPQITTDGQNGAIITWQDNRSGDWDIYAQHLFSGGTVDPAWPANGLPVCVVAGSDQQGPVITSDGAGGAIIAVYAQRVLNLGAVDPDWPVNGQRVSTSVALTNNEYSPRLASDGSNGALVCWAEAPSVGTWAVRAQRLLANDGARNWGDLGVAVSTAIGGHQRTPDIINDGSNGAIITFTNDDIYAQRLTSAGAPSWGANGVAVCNAANTQDSPVLVPDGVGGAVVAWSDDRTGSNRDLYAQRVIPGTGGTGEVAWAANGVGVCTGQAGTFPRAPRITSDGGGGAIIAWEDHRTDMEIYSQRVTSAGGVPWTAGGVLLCNAGSHQEFPEITTDMQGGAIVTWKDTRPPTPSAIVNAYAQRVNGGAVKWAAGGVRLCTNDAYQLQGQIVSDGKYGAIATWQDWRTGIEDIYAQRVSDDAPTVTGIAPSKGFNNGTVNCTITGTGFNNVPGAHGKLRKGATYIYGTNNVVVSGTQLTCDFDLTDKDFGLYDVVVFSGDGQSGTQIGGFNLKSFRPVIQGILPLDVKPGDLVTITGGGFGDTQGTGASGGAASYVSFGGLQPSAYTEWTDTEIKCYVPGGASSGNVTVTTTVGTSNAQALVVNYPRWYLAEGSTAWGFGQYITIENPNGVDLVADITYMPTEGANVTQAVSLPANSQTTVNPEDKLGQKDFSTMVVCRDATMNIAVDRTMNWRGQGSAYSEAHSSIGVTAPNRTWYLPEGSSAWGFECWLLIQNPQSTDATVDVTYMIEGADPVTVRKTVPKTSRKTFNIADDIGAQDASIQIQSNVPVIPERAMYRYDRREGHDSIGTTAPASSYYLAEGTTAWGFTTYILVQNPWSTATDVTLTFMTTSGARVLPKFNMPANSRKTIRVNDISAANGYPIDMTATDFSTRVTGSKAIIAERAMYWGAGTNMGEACHDSIGMSSAHSTFYLPDGQATPEDGPVETFTLVQNPNSTDVKIEVSYLTPNGEGNVVFTDTVPKNSRRTYNMADRYEGRASVKVVSQIKGKKIMVEQAIYIQGRAGGTNTIGGFSD
jgi:hypothetical protein